MLLLHINVNKCVHVRVYYPFIVDVSFANLQIITIPYTYLNTHLSAHTLILFFK